MCASSADADHPTQSECSLKASGLPRMQNFLMRTTNIVIRLHVCAGWFESLLNAHVRRNHYGNMPIPIYRKFHLQKLKKKNSDSFHISAQNIDCRYSLEPPRRGGSNEYTQSMFSSKNKKNNVCPCKPQFYYIKVGFKGGQNYIGMFSWWCSHVPAQMIDALLNIDENT